VAKSKEVETRWSNVAESTKESYGLKRAVLAMIVVITDDCVMFRKLDPSF
jgi:hypothetical protein